jgi:ribosomal protein L32
MSIFTSQVVREHYASITGELAARTATEARAETEAMRFDVEKLFLITEALWTLLKEKHGYTEEQLVKRIQAIDLQDGKLDGKRAKASSRSDCPACGRKQMTRHPVCLFCGTKFKLDPFKR